ncbi:crispr-associated ramp protein, Cmr4 family [Sulfurihydrogenibium azorense Az-Fu1]|jgi:CRISPR-associated protein Cmr4|uniref:Crispr-associated ramp protein, Cmr4 family n=1 Tax=Sulfurihydrogenibium azorense (strain DSM 15241 / OCM 825 / Az-Fu1) TaxID=204536 RepID=C1DUQ0_SULAA|nr:RAMP superfamily CRISPR-associated protein [Sulfurihydrogenibium azorense]ACN99502.1 crispr-associated ramp protein, Cmr4 family [Sulfurihydrogenibium azorense Az-Fu1]
MVETLKIFALATDPIYIGTGGYTIGRVDNTIVRDPITNIPKIPGSSLAGTWRYYVVLEALTLKDLKDKQTSTDENKSQNGSTSDEKLENCNGKNNPTNDWKAFLGNQVLRVNCAGQDDAPFVERNDKNNTGHCGCCIVCKGFGFSKKDISWQGMIFFSDLKILLFPVFTFKGTKWITTASILQEIGINESSPRENKIKTKNGNERYLNLGWLYLEVESNHNISNSPVSNFSLKPEDIVIVPESLFSHIVNSNLEVRTSVSIDPITGSAKEGALFTTEAIPRGTIFYGNIRIFDKNNFINSNNKMNNKIGSLPSCEQLKDALKDSARYYESLGIGGMTTRGFGRLKIELINGNSQSGGSQNGQSNQ